MGAIPGALSKYATRVRGHSRSSKMIQFDPAPMTSH